MVTLKLLQPLGLDVLQVYIVFFFLMHPVVTVHFGMTVFKRHSLPLEDTKGYHYLAEIHIVAEFVDFVL